MLRRGLSAILLVLAVLVALARDGVVWSQGTPGSGDTLLLQQPEGIKITPSGLESPQFTNFIFWEDIPRDIGALVHRPDTSGWNPVTSSTPDSELSLPVSGGLYMGSIDRTVKFFAKNNGVIGQDSINIQYEVVKEEHFNQIIGLSRTYQPNTFLPVLFKDENNPGVVVDFGLEIAFSPGRIDSNGIFIVGLEDFEGFHIWRGIDPEGRDLTVLGEVSKEEEFAGSLLDSLYFADIIPSLRETGRYSLPGPVPGLGEEINLGRLLGPNEMWWFDANAFNGFTYYYTVTTFDRGYNVQASRPGLFKFDNCTATQGEPYECAEYLVTMTNNVTSQDNLKAIYTVPNPFRSGTTQFSAPNYHNFPDNKIRFVNVPASCRLKIYTTAGDLVRRITHNGPGNIEWDTTNDLGEQVASGIYLWRIKDDNDNDVYGRLIIIR